MAPPSGSRYESLLPIGTGGVATVSLGRHLADGRLVALKRAHPHVKDDPVLAATLLREARLASCLQHPNVVRVLDVEDAGGELLLVLDYVEGATLRGLTSRLRRAGLERPREIVRVVLDAAHGLHAAHGAVDAAGRLLGLVHRDVSPSNVLVGLDGVARIADFGLAKAQADATEKTETGILKGKTSYMAPEYVVHQQARPASDLFSLAVLAWEALSGARLFKGANDVETLLAVASAETRPLASERPELAMLDPVLGRALARWPEARQASTLAFADELEAVARAHGLLATHAEVGALVHQLFADELADRRQKLERDAETMAAPLSIADARLLRESIEPPGGGMPIDPDEATTRRTSGREAIARTPSAPPVHPGSVAPLRAGPASVAPLRAGPASVAPMGVGTRGATQRTSASLPATPATRPPVVVLPDPARPSWPPGRPSSAPPGPMPSSLPPPPLRSSLPPARTTVPPPPRPSRAAAPSRGDLLALAGALALFALAVSLLFQRVGEEGPPPPRPAAPPPDAGASPTLSTPPRLRP